jgi:hypothetical protein
VYLSSRDLSRLIRHLPQLCDRGAVVVWVRGTVADKHSPDSIRDRLRSAGFTPVRTDVETPWDFHVGVERFEGTPVPLQPGVRLFAFRDPLRLTHHTLRRARKRVARALRREAR